ncbi:DMSO/TMAO reductase YedYZ molybdopterin-dependent catalytic subunit [Streptomyces sp. KhCrAH-43]|uniref:molybdopterin-dependent oxidoreductase n=1 Tax=unclassified Streptomyces TaxID=2593676 RepID=UPI0003634EEC|nr:MULTISPECIES: molybdopterin-dependent oxidoreductase [unclassified Streptomyces]MYS33118.1 molybdopterin-dependent oxidoreductase [Streptomyces sp. SID4920]MYX67683.1 molybdopterin-dependent oxidoreductase [Streptomyces sp. SID8373]RAJ58088.1 DMSO/TMAO reductase YedYZ molybdopterin-dependent catalytic subunit [Streptomyces sp. KhCrAH-43]
MGDSRRNAPTSSSTSSRPRATGLLERLPSAPGFWRSPVRGVPFTAVLGIVLLAGITLLFVTGLLSYAAYNPDLNPVNDKTPDKGLLGFYLFPWPTSPHWLYRLTQGLHVTVGIVLVPVLLAKLWSVVPRLFTLPPARSLAHALERISLLLLVGGALFEFVTGLLNIQLEYLFPGSFYPLHFYGAWVFFAAFLAHAGLRAPQAVRVLRTGGLDGPVPDDVLESPAPARPTVSRRGALAMVGAGSLVLLVTSAGRSFDGPLRRLAALTPHGAAEPGSGPNGFQINKTAAAVGITTAETGEGWWLTVSGPAGDLRFSRAQLLAMEQHSAALPIACVEGWSTSDQWWRGVRLSDLAALAGYPDRPPGVLVESLQRKGAFRRAALRDNQVRDPRSLLALRVNGEDLSPDHGYPARVIVPAAPGVLNTKWVARLTFGDL